MVTERPPNSPIYVFAPISTMADVADYATGGNRDVESTWDLIRYDRHATSLMTYKHYSTTIMACMDELKNVLKHKSSKISNIDDSSDIENTSEDHRQSNTSDESCNNKVSRPIQFHNATENSAAIRPIAEFPSENSANRIAKISPARFQSRESQKLANIDPPIRKPEQVVTALLTTKAGKGFPSREPTKSKASHTISILKSSQGVARPQKRAASPQKRAASPEKRLLINSSEYFMDRGKCSSPNIMSTPVIENSRQASTRNMPSSNQHLLPLLIPVRLIDDEGVSKTPSSDDCKMVNVESTINFCLLARDGASEKPARKFQAQKITGVLKNITSPRHSINKGTFDRGEKSLTSDRGKKNLPRINHEGSLLTDSRSPDNNQRNKNLPSAAAERKDSLRRDSFLSRNDSVTSRGTSVHGTRRSHGNQFSGVNGAVIRRQKQSATRLSRLAEAYAKVALESPSVVEEE